MAVWLCRFMVVVIFEFKLFRSSPGFEETGQELASGVANKFNIVFDLDVDSE